VGKTIQVTSAQVNAARLWIERADRDGKITFGYTRYAA